MNRDITKVEDGEDLKVEQSEAPRAGNILSVQLASLEYAPTLGIDLKYFLASDFQFQNESFKAYCVQRLMEHQVNVSNVIPTIEALYEEYRFQVGDQNTKSEAGLIA